MPRGSRSTGATRPTRPARWRSGLRRPCPKRAARRIATGCARDGGARCSIVRPRLRAPAGPGAAALRQGRTTALDEARPYSAAVASSRRHPDATALLAGVPDALRAGAWQAAQQRSRAPWRRPLCVASSKACDGGGTGCGQRGLALDVSVCGDWILRCCPLALPGECARAPWRVQRDAAHPVPVGAPCSPQAGTGASVRRQEAR